MPTTTEPYEAVILAGGQGSRMGGCDKGLVVWQGQALFQHVLARLQAQTCAPQQLRISANRNPDQYATLGKLAIVADLRQGFNGPLAGIEAALLSGQTDWLLCVPCDMPKLPIDLAERLLMATGAGALAAYAVSPAGPQPVCCLLHRQLAGSLSAFLDAGQGRVWGWLASVDAEAVQFAHADDFINCNTLAALAVVDEQQP